MGERRRETEKERERRGSETDVPKLYTYNEYELSVYGMLPSAPFLVGATVFFNARFTGLFVLVISCFEHIFLTMKRIPNEYPNLSFVDL